LSPWTAVHGMATTGRKAKALRCSTAKPRFGGTLLRVRSWYGGPCVKTSWHGPGDQFHHAARPMAPFILPYLRAEPVFSFSLSAHVWSLGAVGGGKKKGAWLIPNPAATNTARWSAGYGVRIAPPIRVQIASPGPSIRLFPKRPTGQRQGLVSGAGILFIFGFCPPAADLPSGGAAHHGRWEKSWRSPKRLVECNGGRTSAGPTACPETTSSAGGCQQPIPVQVASIGSRQAHRGLYPRGRSTGPQSRSLDEGRATGFFCRYGASPGENEISIPRGPTG